MKDKFGLHTKVAQPQFFLEIRSIERYINIDGYFKPLLKELIKQIAKDLDKYIKTSKLIL